MPGGLGEHLRQQLISKPVSHRRRLYTRGLHRELRRCVHTVLHLTRIDCVVQTADTLRAAILIVSVAVAPVELNLEQLLQALELRGGARPC